MGIDPGVNVTGYGLVEISPRHLQCVDYGGIVAEKGASLGKKLEKIYHTLRVLITQHQPSAIAIEDIFYYENVKTAIRMGQVRGVSILAAQLSGIPYFEYAPREVKMAVVGNGAASKQQVQAMVQTILALPEIPQPYDAADALAVAICHINRLKTQQFKEVAEGL